MIVSLSIFLCLPLLTQSLSLQLQDTTARCLTFSGRSGQHLLFDYTISGRSEDKLEVEILNDDGKRSQLVVGKSEQGIIANFTSKERITVCLRSQDRRSKTVTIYPRVQDTAEKKGSGLSLDHINESINKLKKVQSLFEMISRNIYIKNDIDKELYDSNPLLYSLGI